ncbi:MAG: ORF6N domain-containing protein [Campylobacterota bacterium]
MSALAIQTGIENRIFTIRGLQVMIDRDLAELYGVEPKRLGEQVKRNIESAYFKPHPAIQIKIFPTIKPTKVPMIKPITAIKTPTPTSALL